MSKIIEELSLIPEWNDLGKDFKRIFAEMDKDKVDNLDKKSVEEIIEENCEDKAIKLVSKLVMTKINDEIRQEAKDDFDFFVKRVKGEL